MDPEWEQYQESVAQFFRDLGLNAETNVIIDGIRTKHAIDVFVESAYKGISIKWVIECKSWRRRVPKLNVLALRTIVDDVGADRGFLMNEVGYQKGAREVAYLTNVHLTSLQDLRETCEHDLAMMRVRKLYLRALACKSRYWELSKPVRIKHGLRGEVGSFAYSGDRAVKSAENVLLSAIFHGFPVFYSDLLGFLAAYSDGAPHEFDDSVTFTTPTALADYISERLDELEYLLAQAESDPKT